MLILYLLLFSVLLDGGCDLHTGDCGRCFSICIQIRREYVLVKFLDIIDVIFFQ